MKLFNVTIETEIVVVAETREEAEVEAQKVVRDLDYSDFAFHAAPFRYFPADWDANAIPYGHRDPADPDRTIQGWQIHPQGQAVTCASHRWASLYQTQAFWRSEWKRSLDRCRFGNQRFILNPCAQAPHGHVHAWSIAKER